MKNKKLIENKVTSSNDQEISRKDALKKIGKYGKYAALTAIGTYILLNPTKAQAQSPPGSGF
ncbi:MAG: hypothetical protein COA67_09035 [Lutibacter sp.]|nr:MAG: hypothetical protein COA67_09035 [Lutibacter sp.]